MSLGYLILLIVVLGLLLGFVNKFFDMEPKTKEMLNYLVILILAISFVVWLLSVFGIVSIGGHPLRIE